MAISLTEEFRTAAELGEDPEGVLKRLRKTGRPVNITLNGKPAAVILDVATFERMVRALNLARLIGPAEEDMIAGRTQPLDEFMKEFERANKIPRANSRPSKAGRSGNSRLHRKGQTGRGS